MADFDQTWNSNSSYVIPAYAINIQVEVAGARGGNGGNDSAPGGTGGQGRKAILYLPNFIGRTLSWTLGSRGGDGFGCVSNSGAGSGGAGAAAGGRGGNTGPQGCSGGGGGGGGATALFDTYKGGYLSFALIAVLGGGGGAGGGSHPNASFAGGNGRIAYGLLSGNGSLSNGGVGTSQGYDGGGGGGGGGGSPGGSGGREGADDRAGGYASGGGDGGASWYDSNYATFTYNSGSGHNGNGFVRISYDIAQPVINTFTATPSTIIRGAPVTLAWTTQNTSSGDINRGVGTVSMPNSSVIVYPNDDIVYTLTAFGLAGGLSTTASVGVVVYIPPVLNLFFSATGTNTHSIIAGQSTTIEWFTSGDGDTLFWTQGGLTNTNLSSTETVNPSTTTTYAGYVTGLGGTSPTATATLRVFQLPTLDVVWPESIDYGFQGTIAYTTSYSNISVTLSRTYTYEVDGNSSGTDVALNKPSSAEAGIGLTSVTDTFDTTIPYNNRGPVSVSYVIVATGDGGSVSASYTVPINIDRTPDNFNIPESDDLLNAQPDVVTPETVITSEQILVDDVDIDVEVKSNYPIKVQVNNDGVWNDLREI